MVENKNSVLFSFPLLERSSALGGLQMFPYLNGEIANYEGEPSASALYWYFGDLIAQRFSDSLDCVAWSTDTISVADRRIQIAEIDKQIEALTSHRDGLANDLIGSGMYE